MARTRKPPRPFALLDNIRQIGRTLSRRDLTPSQRLENAFRQMAPGEYERFQRRARMFEELARSEYSRLRTDPNSNEQEVEAFLAVLRASVKTFQNEPPRTWAGRRVVDWVSRNLGQMEHALLPSRQEAFAVLGVQVTDDLETIKVRFRSLAREAHPDKPGGSHARMQKLNEAYKTVVRIKGGN